MGVFLFLVEITDLNKWKIPIVCFAYRSFSKEDLLDPTNQTLSSPARPLPLQLPSLAYFTSITLYEGGQTFTSHVIRSFIQSETRDKFKTRDKKDRKMKQI